MSLTALVAFLLALDRDGLVVEHGDHLESAAERVNVAGDG